MRNLRLATALSVALMASCTVAAQDSATPRVVFSIAEQPLGSALTAFAKQARVQILSRDEDVAFAGKRAPAINGELPVREALDRLLANTELEYEFINERTVRITTLATPRSAVADPGSSVIRLAQAPDATVPVNKQRDGARTPAANSETQSNGPRIEEVIVTAQKRSERLQDVPMSIDAVSLDRLRSMDATRLADVAAEIPGFQINSQTGQPGSANITLRGITTADIQSTTTAITIDDVPVGSSTTYAYAALSSIDLLPYDLDHIEVLKGPQGTLYGATSLGGLVKYVTTTPDLERYSARIGGSVSTIDRSGESTRSGRAVINLPIVQGVFGISASAGHSYQAGYIGNIATGERDFNHGEQDSARLTGLWTPDDRFIAKITALYNSSDFRGLGSVAFDPQVNRPVYGPFATLFDEPFRDRRNQKIFIADLSYDMGFATLTSITGHSDSEGIVRYDASQIPFYRVTYRDNGIVVPGEFTGTTERFTQELRLAADSGALRWRAGAFYNKERSRFVEHIDAIILATRQPDPASTPFYAGDTPSRIEESAFFGDLTYAITDSWDVGAGLRYGDNRQRVSTTVGGALVGGGVSQSPEFRSSDSSVTYVANTRLRLNPHAMLYGRIATGYRPGGANTILGVPPTFKPDETTSYELGLKSELLDQRLLFNVAVFYIDWTDIHLTDRLPNQLPFIGNGGEATSQGLELSTAYEITREFRLSAVLAYTDAQLETDAPNVGASKGDALPNNPEWSGLARLDWVRPISTSYEATGSLTWRYVDSRISAFPNAQGGAALLDAYDSIDLTAGIAGERWRANLFVKNLTNEEAYLSYSNFGATILQPRALGLSLDFDF